jgi:hypothetical protein
MPKDVPCFLRQYGQILAAFGIFIAQCSHIFSAMTHLPFEIHEPDITGTTL